MTLRVHLFGDLLIERGGERLDLRALTPKARAVLKIIALRHGHVIPSEELIERLWPERDPKKALANLRVLVSQIRSALGDARLIAGGRSGYRFLDDDAWFDVDEFERLADAGRVALLDGRTEVATAHLEQALSLYGGDLVEADAYEEWAVGPRGRLRERHLAAREDQADALTIGGRARDAISLLERVLEGDRCREGAYRRLMLAHYLAGEQGGALRAYERCRSVLEDELGVDPLPETMALHERILRREVAAPKPARTETCAPAGLPFVGRAAERALIDAALTRRATGVHVVAIVGEAGAGKTRLAEEAIRGRRDVQVLRTRCYELERALPFQPLVDSLSRYLDETGDVDTIRRALGASLPWLAVSLPRIREGVPAVGEPPALPAEQARAKLVAALGDAVLALARGHTLAWWIEDVHWADDSTLEVVHYIARRASGASVALLVTARVEDMPVTHPVARLVGDLARDRRAQQVSLGPLPVEEIIALGRAVGAPEMTSRAIHERTGGNAFFATEILRDWRASDAGGSLPLTVRDAVLARTCVIPQAARRALDAAAVLGGRIDVDVLALVAGSEMGVVADALDLLVERRLLRALPTAGEHTFAHDLVRAAVYEAIGEARRVVLHRRAAQALEQLRPEVPGETAYHAERGADLGRAFRHALAAGERAAAAYSMREALVHLDRALRVAPAARVEGRLLRRSAVLRADARDHLGLASEARVDLDAALASARHDGDRPDEAVTLLRVAELEGGRDYESAVRFARSALEVARAAEEPALLVRCLKTLALMLVNRARLGEAATLLEEAKECATALEGEPLVDLLNAIALVAFFRGDFAAARTQWSRALGLLDRQPSTPRRTTILQNLAGCDLFGELERGLATVAEAERASREADAPADISYCLTIRAILLTERGSLDEALRSAEEAAVVASRIGHREWLIHARLAAAGAACARGDSDLALASVEAAWREIPALGSAIWTANGRFYRACARAAAGELEAAVGELRDLFGAAPLPVLRLLIGAALAELLLRQGDAAAAISVVDELGGRWTGMPILSAYFDGIVALAGVDDDALRAAVAELRQLGGDLRAERLESFRSLVLVAPSSSASRSDAAAGP